MYSFSKLIVRRGLFRKIRYFSNAPKISSPWQKAQWFAFASVGGLTAGLSFYFATNHNKKQNEVISFGTPKIGGDFSLIDHNGRRCSLKDFAGKWILIYFGFCHCPDVCPEQLERIVDITERVSLKYNKAKFLPLFITVDPERDNPSRLKEYLGDFSPLLLGLTGNLEDVKDVSKKFRIYVSAGEKDADGDYIVDHTIVMYLMNPRGEFVTYYGQVKPVQEIVRDIIDQMEKFE